MKPERADTSNTLQLLFQLTFVSANPSGMEQEFLLPKSRKKCLSSLYGFVTKLSACETWSLNEEHVRSVENRVPCGEEYFDFTETGRRLESLDDKKI
jgi:hypothetical protein